MADRLYLGIDTSNYTTSLALCDSDGKVIANIKKILDVKVGERGLRQSDAVFSHVKNLPELCEKLKSVVADNGSISAIGVSVTPRDVIDSYMPCFLVGKATAYAIASSINVPVYEFSHQSGHIMAALYSSSAMETLIKRDFVAFHISGGTTEALYVRPQENGFSVDIIANTLDISAGQAIDRAGVMMGLKFPCGIELEDLANKNDKKIPSPRISVHGGKMNFSGLENISQKLYKDTNDSSYVSAFILNFIAKTLQQVTENIRETYPDIPILYAGGVMSNRYLKSELSKFNDTYFATPEFSSDNAAGISLLAKRSDNK